ncbi:mutator MutT protein [Candidatus Nitrosoglobus terrae]|uniref:8-oxo-dGTP diphosphatase n=1 Tax=Candidatus Nitrosoglobus terrae TaxID=1630141 RepID=A0A1Q2SPN6_9GAMM|nr:Nudix family hydrolase [Candidatus Nitrosoglobus terrae]BAW81098.1 mutator MutT protein [Candidatus Nitrosoglobus terrae]
MIRHVAVGVIFNEQGQVLLSKRPSYVHQGNLWEFPGGKLNSGESVSQALSRELKEELGLKVLKARPLIQIHHNYSDCAVLLDTWKVEGFSGVARGREGQPIRWVWPKDLSHYNFPAANQSIVSAAQLPSTYLITGDLVGDQAVFLGYLSQSLIAGMRLVQLRAKTLSFSDYASLAEEAQSLCARYGAALLLNTTPIQAVALGADGVHLTSERLMLCSQRPLATSKWVAASCHSAEQLTHAANIGVDFAVLGPVLKTQSHPHALPLGWDQLQTLIAGVSFPVYALGGLGWEHLEESWNRGAQGIAAIRSFWGKGLSGISAGWD